MALPLLSENRTRLLAVGVAAFVLGAAVGGAAVALRHLGRRAPDADPVQRQRAMNKVQELTARHAGNEACTQLCLAGIRARKKRQLAEARVLFGAAAQRGRDWRLPYLALAELKRDLGDDTSANELVALAPPDALGGGEPLLRLWREEPQAAVHAEAVYQGTKSREWDFVVAEARETLKLRPTMTGVLVRRFRALRELDRMEEAKELLAELRRRLPLYLLWNDLVGFVHTRYAPEQTDRLSLKTWDLPNVFDVHALADNRVSVVAGERGIRYLKPDGGEELLRGTAVGDGCDLWPHLALPMDSGEIWLVGRNSDSASVGVWKEGKVHDETPVPPVGALPDFGQLFAHAGEVWGVCGGIVFRQSGTTWIAYVPARGPVRLALPPGIWQSARRRWNRKWQADANESPAFKSETEGEKYYLTRYWKQLATESGLEADDGGAAALSLWHDSEGRLWYGTQQFSGKVFLAPAPKIREAFRQAWWLAGTKWWEPSEHWRREWVYLRTHFRDPGDSGPLIRGMDLDSTGRLWVGLWEAGLMAFDGHRWMAVPLKDVPATIRAVRATSDGAVWVACEDRVVRVKATVADQR
jgi:hypothetical protein